MSVRLINKESFNDVLKDKIVFVDFFAKWCGPCKMISPIIDEISENIKDVTFIKVDVDESSELANMFGVMSIPTLLLFKEGKLVNKSVGFMSKDEIMRFIDTSRWGIFLLNVYINFICDMITSENI